MYMYVGLGWVGLAWVGLGWIGLDWVKSTKSKKSKALPCDRAHFSTGAYNRQILGRLVARRSAVFVFDLRNPRAFHVIERIFLPETIIGKFWEALWLGTRPLLCLT